MELRDIELFLTLAEELHFGRTAQRMYVSTGRVSQTITALEREIGAPLFVRTSRQVQLTPLGERFRAEVGDGVKQLRQAIDGMRAIARPCQTQPAAPGRAVAVPLCAPPTSADRPTYPAASAARSRQLA